MLKRTKFILPILALAALFMFISPPVAQARVHFGIYVGPPAYPYPAYPAVPYAYPYDYPYPNTYAYPYGGYGYGYGVYGNPHYYGDYGHWRHERHEWREHREHEWREHHGRYRD